MATPLIDVTDSPYIALHFAAYDAMRMGKKWKADGRFAVWCIPANLWRRGLESEGREYFMVEGFSAEELWAQQATFRADNSTIPRGNRFEKIVISNVFPRVLRNDRLVAQQGSFIRVTPDLPLDHVVSIMHYWPNNDPGAFVPMKDHLIQYTLPASCALECLTNLSKMNIRPNTLFPDMVGQMAYLNLTLDHYDYAGQGDKLRMGSAFHSDGRRREDFCP